MGCLASRLFRASALIGALWASHALACDADMRCEVSGGYYRVLTPPGWDGKARLAAMMFFHGYRMKAEDIVSDPDFIGFVRRSGTLLIVPNGEGGSWSHTGSPARNRDEKAFLTTVLDDVARRFPIDPSLFWASGFSQGGAMAWDAACYLGERFAAFAPISGGWWKPQPERCPSGPAHIRHVHGLNDRQVPIEGRTIRQIHHQGDVRDGLATWRRINGCRPEPSRREMKGNLTCDIWSGCAAGKEIQFCTHPGGHDLDPGWLDQASAWVKTHAAR